MSAQDWSWQFMVLLLVAGLILWRLDRLEGVSIVVVYLASVRDHRE